MPLLHAAALWLNAKNNFQLNQQKLILNHELSTYLETIQKMSVCIFSHINANIYMQQGLQVIKMEHKYLLDIAYMKFIISTL